MRCTDGGRDIREIVLHVASNIASMKEIIFNSAGRLLRIVIAVAGCYGTWQCVEFARADLSYQQDTVESVRRAIALVPDGWAYYVRLAQLDPANARELLKRSLALNSYDAEADIDLALNYEADGDMNEAEKLLLQAAHIDSTYAPRWSLANFYFRRGNVTDFWVWARSAAQMPSEDIGLLLEMCWRVSPDPEEIGRHLLNDKPEFLRQYTGWLLSREHFAAVEDVAARLVARGDMDSDRPLLLVSINRLANTGRGTAADALWRLLVSRGWVRVDRTLPNNPRFAREPIPVVFDWSLPEYPGLHSWPGASGLESEFTGREPEECTIAEQSALLQPKRYGFAYSYRTSGSAPMSGIRWQVIDPATGAVLAESEDLSSNEPQRGSLSFAVPAENSLVQFRLAYKRTLGTPRVAGTLVVSSTEVAEETER